VQEAELPRELSLFASLATEEAVAPVLCTPRLHRLSALNACFSRTHRRRFCPPAATFISTKTLFIHRAISAPMQFLPAWHIACIFPLFAGICGFPFSFPQPPRLRPLFVPNQTRVIHLFFCCRGSSRLLIHAYSWHNRQQERFLNNCSKSRVRGSKVQKSNPRSEH